VAAGRNASKNGGEPKKGVFIVTRRVAGATWRLAYGTTVTDTCWALLVPRVTIEGGCGLRGRIARRPVSLYTGGTRSGPAGAAYVVYGLVSAQVRALRVVFSDCSVEDVSLHARPLFWTVISGRRARNGVFAIRFAATLASGRAFRSLLTRPNSRCAASL
jgi:hypothetical protein